MSLGRDPLDGRYRQLSRTVDGTKREAQRALAALITEVSAGRETGANATVADLLAQWLDLAAEQLSPTTLRTYQQNVRTRLGPAIGSVRVRKLRAQELDQLYGALMRDGKLSPTTVRQVHSVIRRALAQAVRWVWVPVNVAANATPPRARKPHLDPPKVADVQKILAAAFEENTEFGIFLHFVAASGARGGEACALRWSDIDLETGIVIISRSIINTPSGGYLEKDTKTHAIRKLALDVERWHCSTHTTAVRPHAAPCAAPRFHRKRSCSASLPTPRGRGIPTPPPHGLFACGTTSVSTTCDCTTCATCMQPNSSPPASRSAPSPVASDTPTPQQLSTSTRTSSKQAIAKPRPSWATSYDRRDDAC